MTIPLVLPPWVRDDNGDCRFCAPDEKCAICLALEDGRAVIYDVVDDEEDE